MTLPNVNAMPPSQPMGPPSVDSLQQTAGQAPTEQPSFQPRSIPVRDQDSTDSQGTQSQDVGSNDNSQEDPFYK